MWGSGYAANSQAKERVLYVPLAVLQCASKTHLRAIQNSIQNFKSIKIMAFGVGIFLEN